MKSISPSVIFSVACLSLSTLGSVAHAGEEADHEALRGLVAEYEQAIAEANPGVLEPYLADDFTGVMVTGEAVDGMESLQDYWDKIQGMMGKEGKYSVEIVIPEPATIVGDLAYAHGTTNDKVITGSGKEYGFHGFWTAVCRKEGEEWKIVRIHGSMDAVTNTFVMAAVKSSSTWSGILGGVIGLVVTAIVCAVISRRRGSIAAAS